MRLTCFVALLLLFAACRTTAPVIDTNFVPSNTPLEDVIQSLPNYENEILAIKGSGRAIVSEPGNSDRVSIDFESDTTLSLLTIKNRLGIEGGAMLVDQDSILMYFKVDKIAQKISVNDGRLTALNELASVNLIDLLNFKITNDTALELYESETDYLIRLTTNGGANISKKDGLITKITQPWSAGLPYSSIIYEDYGKLKDYTLPRKITILSRDQNSQVIFQIRSLETNPDRLNLTLDIPENITIERL